MKIATLLICLVFAVAPAAKPQGQVGDFTWSPSEHIIDEIDQPFVVKSLMGMIAVQGDGPLAGVLFEIQGPGTDRKIRRCKTDEYGRFKIGHVPQGTYRFKATLVGFQSVMGTITVSKKAAKAGEIRIAMPVGV
ncbi:MAG: carboxypeptidase regulatory-like domain-containing protein [Terracidiphilus sp.]